MTKKELLELPGFKNAKDDAQIWILAPDVINEFWPTDAYFIGFADGTENLIIKTKDPDDTWQSARMAYKTLNEMELGIFFYPALFTYLRKKGRLGGLCELGKRGKQKVWLYDTEGIADLVKNGQLKYRQHD